MDNISPVLAEKLESCIGECARTVLAEVVSASYMEDLYELAKSVAYERKVISASYLQRRLGISYGRAAKLISRLEADGMVSPANGTRARIVIGC